MSSLHLDAEEEPRRVTLTANSRANSVRFDESANQNHFSHLSRPSFDYLSRSSSSMGGLTLGERSSSHKSEGRASSAHSVRSAASGRASLNLDTSYPGDSSRPSETPALAPGLAFLGSVPAIIRCWMNTNFKHDALLYAAICTGSYRSFLSAGLVEKLGFEDMVTIDEHGTKTVELPIYFPEAVPHPTSSRSSSPAPQLPSLTTVFHIVESQAGSEIKAIQVIIGSDTLRLHNADILFSSSSLSLFDDERNKLSIPLVRPENASTFNSLRTVHAGYSADDRGVNGTSHEEAADTAATTKYRAPIGLNADSAASSDSARPGSRMSERDVRPASRGSAASRPLLTLTSRTDVHDEHATQRSASGSPAVWSNWRKEPVSAHGSTPALNLDWAAASKNRDVPSTFQRRDTGMRVLKPKSASRAVSGSAMLTANSASSPVSATDANRSSRYFDEGRRKSGGAGIANGLADARSDVDTRKETLQSGAIDSVQARPKTNPIGSASAFSWMNSAAKQ